MTPFRPCLVDFREYLEHNSKYATTNVTINPATATAFYYRDILAGGYMLRVLPPWFENLKKRQVKSPKIHIRDSGLLHTLLGIPDTIALRSHPGYGTPWDGFALEQILGLLGSNETAF